MATALPGAAGLGVWREVEVGEAGGQCQGSAGRRMERLPLMPCLPTTLDWHVLDHTHTHLVAFGDRVAGACCLPTVGRDRLAVVGRGQMSTAAAETGRGKSRDQEIDRYRLGAYTVYCVLCTVQWRCVLTVERAGRPLVPGTGRRSSGAGKYWKAYLFVDVCRWSKIAPTEGADKTTTRAATRHGQ